MKRHNTVTQRPSTPDGSLATETRKPGSLKRVVSLRSVTRRKHTCPSCKQDMREEPHAGLGGKDCPQCGQGMSWRRAKRKQANDPSSATRP